MKYINQHKFVDAFRQMKKKKKLTTKAVAEHCKLSQSYIYRLTSPRFPKKLISIILVKEIAFGFGMNNIQTKQWIFQMGTIYNSKDALSKPSRSRQSARKYSRHPSRRKRRHHRIKLIHHRRAKSQLTSLTKWIISTALLIIVAMTIYTGWVIYHGHETAEQRIVRLTQNHNDAYDQDSLKEKTDQVLSDQLTHKMARKDHQFIQSVTYSPHNNSATVHLNKRSAKLINYAATTHQKKASQRLKRAIRQGVKIDNRLTNQAIKIANQSHNGYFTFRFDNAQKYEAPNT